MRDEGSGAIAVERGMYGRRGRIGFIPPANLETTLFELDRLLPDDVALVASVLRINNLVRSEINAQLEGVERAAGELRQLDVDLIALSGGPVVYLNGVGFDRAIAARAERAGGRPAFHDVTAVQDALRHLGARRIAIVSPFTDEVNRCAVTFFEAAGFEVLSIVGGGLGTNVEIRRVPTEVPYHLGLEALANAPSADALFISCAGWCSLPSVERLERELGIPVVTQTQALAWRALRMLGVALPIAGRGRLLGSAEPAPAA